MPKARITALDVRAMVTSIMPEISRLRVANVYDISSKVYVLKLSEGETKKHLLLEAGVRFHLSAWKRDKQSVPSVFTMRLRKFLRTKRIASIQQLGGDRVIDLQFGYNENAVHLIVEFYARGNVVLTDHEYTVKATWRQFRADEALAVRMNMTYPIEEYTKETNLVACGIAPIEAGDTEAVLPQARQAADSIKSKVASNINVKKRAKKGDSEADDLSVPLTELACAIFPAAHQALVRTVAKTLEVQDERVQYDKVEDSMSKLMALLQGLLGVFRRVSYPGSLGGPALGGEEEMMTVRGFVHLSRDEEGKLHYEDFAPIEMVRKDKDDWILKTFETFHQAVDEYFTSVELVKAEKVTCEKLNELESKIDKIKRDQKERVDKLQAERDLAEQQALCVEYHVNFVAKALEMMKRAVDSGSDWHLLEQMVKEQRRLNHPVATYIKSLDLPKKRFTLLVGDVSFGENFDEEESEMKREDCPLVPVDLEIDETAFSNVQRLHSEKKAAQLKFEKTQVAAARVVAQAEAAAAKEKSRKELASETRPAIQRMRKVYWFEKFYWFISSDNYLVLAGHDATQNEILYRKYLRKNDLYVHADVHGAATCVIRNPSSNEVPQRTIDEAGCMSVCRSNAWKSKVLTSAYWVYAHQVSKTPQPGEYVSTGGFIIRGKRNPILVKKLEMAIGILFHLGDEESMRRHLPELPDSTISLAKVDAQSSSGAAASSTGRKGSLKSHSSRVQFGSFEVLPTTELEAHVDFENLPPEVIHVHSERSILSDEEHRDSDAESSDSSSEGNDVVPHPETARSFDLRRPDSADELPPPCSYTGRTAPRDLLAKRTPETAPAALEEDGETETSAGWEVVRAQSKSPSTLATKRSLVVDGGPLPRGYLEEEMPPVRQILRGGSRRLSQADSQLGNPQLSTADSAHGGEPSSPVSPSPARTTGFISRAMRKKMKRRDKPASLKKREADPLEAVLAQAEGEEVSSQTSNQVGMETESAAREESEGLGEVVKKELETSSKASEGDMRKTASTQTHFRKTMGNVPRGKKKKIKKLRERYAEQSDDERELAMRLTGGAKMKSELPPSPKVSAIDLQQKAREEALASKKTALPDRNFEEEDSGPDDDDTWKKRLEALSELVGKPFDGDTITFALPMCAPWSAVQNFLYKGKLLPGGTKKGQAVQLMHRAFIGMTPAESIQRQMIKAISSDEISAVMVASPIVQMPEADKISKADKKAKAALNKALHKAQQKR